MRTPITTCAVLALFCGGVAFAQEQSDRQRQQQQREQRDQEGGRPEAVDQALKQRYGEDVRVEITGTPTDVNGVKIFRVNIRDDRGQSNALVTQYGDFLLAGTPRQFERLPDQVRTTQTLFKSEPQGAESYIADGYYIDVIREGEGGEQLYRLRYDPLGRLREVTNPQEVEKYETTNFQKAENKIAGPVQELAEKHVPRGSKIKDVYVDPRFEGYYVAKYEAPKGGEILVILDEQGNVYQTRTEIDRGELAPPVRQAFERMFDVDNIKWTYRTQYQFYEFQQDTPQGPVTFRVRPTGTIMSVQAPEAERDDEAVTARFKEGERQRNDQDTPGAVIGRDRQDRDQND